MLEKKENKKMVNILQMGQHINTMHTSLNAETLNSKTPKQMTQ